jgi:GNAT superfamily N-acetyltransferase
LIVRRAGEADAEGLVRAHEAAWDATIAPIVGTPLGHLAPLEDRVEQARASLADPSATGRAWVAERDGEIVGMATAGDGELRNLYVAPAAWGSCAARELMRTALDWLAAGGADEAVLWVGEANARARRFYEREGWTLGSETRGSPLGPPEVLYRRAL